MFWPIDGQHYPDKIAGYDQNTGRYNFSYDDADNEKLNMGNETRRILSDIVPMFPIYLNSTKKQSNCASKPLLASNLCSIKPKNFHRILYGMNIRMKKQKLLKTVRKVPVINVPENSNVLFKPRDLQSQG